MKTRPLFATLRYLLVKLRNLGTDQRNLAAEIKALPPMTSLIAFTFVKSLYRQFLDEWSIIDTLTSSTVMPVLQRTKLIATIDASDLNMIKHSALFNDHRLVDVQYAFIVNDDRPHTDFDNRLPQGSRSHRRPIASVSFVRSTTIYGPRHEVPGNFFVSYHCLASFSATDRIPTSRK